MATRLRLSEAENLAETLDVGNFTTDGQQIEAQNGSAVLNLRYTNKDNYAFLGNTNGTVLVDNGSVILEYLIAGIGFRLSVGDSAISLVGANQDSYISTALNLFQQRALSNFANGSKNNLLIIDVTAADRETSSFQSLGFFINTGNGANSSIIKQNVQNCVIVAGQGITAKTDDTLYTNQISLQESTNLFDTILKSSTATADRTATIQDASGTIAYLSDIGTSSFAVNLDSAESTVTRAVAGGRTTFTVTHNLGSLDIKPEVFRLSDGRTIGWRIERTGINIVEASRAGNVANGLFRILI